MNRFIHGIILALVVVCLVRGEVEVKATPLVVPVALGGVVVGGAQSAFLPRLVSRHPWVQKIAVGMASFGFFWWYKKHNGGLLSTVGSPLWLPSSPHLRSSRSLNRTSSSSDTPPPSSTKPPRLSPPSAAFLPDLDSDESLLAQEEMPFARKASNPFHSGGSEVEILQRKFESEAAFTTKIRVQKALQNAGWQGSKVHLSKVELEKWLLSFLQRSDLLSYHIFLSRILRIQPKPRKDIARLWDVSLSYVGVREEALKKELLKIEKYASGGVLSSETSPSSFPLKRPEELLSASKNPLKDILKQEHISLRHLSESRQIIKDLFFSYLNSPLERDIMRALLSSKPFSYRDLAAEHSVDKRVLRLTMREMRALLTLSLSVIPKSFSHSSELLEYQNRLLEALQIHWFSPAPPHPLLKVIKHLDNVERFMDTHQFSNFQRSIFLAELWNLPQISHLDKAQLWGHSEVTIEHITSNMKRAYERFLGGDVADLKLPEHGSALVDVSTFSLKDHLEFFENLSQYKQVHIAFNFHVDSLQGFYYFQSLAYEYLDGLLSDFERHIFLALVLQQTFTLVGPDQEVHSLEHIARSYDSDVDEVRLYQQKIFDEFSYLLSQKMMDLGASEEVKAAALLTLAQRIFKNLDEDDLLHLKSRLSSGLNKSAMSPHVFVNKLKKILTKVVFLPGEKTAFLMDVVPLLPQVSHYQRPPLWSERSRYFRSSLKKWLTESQEIKMW